MTGYFSSSPNPPPRASLKRRVARRIALAAALILAAGVAGLFLFPGTLVRRALDGAGLGRLQFKSCTLSPTGTLTLRDVVMQDAVDAARPLLAARLVQLEFSWWGLRFSQFKRISVDGLEATIRPGEGGDTPVTLTRLLGSPPASTAPQESKKKPEGSPLWFDQLSISGVVRFENMEGMLKVAQIPAGAAFPVRAMISSSGDRRNPTREVVAIVGDPDAAATSPAANLPVLSTRFRVNTSPTTTLSFDVLTLSNLSPAVPAQWLAGAPEGLRRDYAGHLDRLQFSGTVSIARDITLALAADVRDFSAHGTAPPTGAPGERRDGPPVALEHFAANTRIDGRWTASPLRDLAFSHTRCTFDAIQFGDWRLTRGVADLQNDPNMIMLNDLQAVFGDAPLSATAAFDLNAKNFSRARLWLNNVDAAKLLARLPAEVRQQLPVTLDGIVGARFFLTESDAEHMGGRVEFSCPDQLTLLAGKPALPPPGNPGVASAQPAPFARISNVAASAAVSWNMRLDSPPDLARGRLTADAIDLLPAIPLGKADPSPPFTRILSDFSMSKGQVRLEDLYATLPEGGNLLLRGAYTPATRSLFPVTLNIDNLDASLLAPWLPPSVSTAGQINSEFQLTLTPHEAGVVAKVYASNDFEISYGRGSVVLSGAPSPTVLMTASADLDRRSLQVDALSLQGFNTVAANAEFVQQLREALGVEPGSQGEALFERFKKGVVVSMDEGQASGKVELGPSPVFSGPLHLFNLAVRTPDEASATGPATQPGANAVGLDRLSIKADVRLPLQGDILEGLRIATSRLTIGKVMLAGSQVTQMSGQLLLDKGKGTLSAVNFVFDEGAFSGDGVLSLSRGLEDMHLTFNSVEQGAVTRQLYPDRFTAEGPVSGTLDLFRTQKGTIGGMIVFDGDAPGKLHIAREVSEALFAPVARTVMQQGLGGGSNGAGAGTMVPGNFDEIVVGQLADYPYSQAHIDIRDVPQGMEIGLKYVRPPLKEGEPGYGAPVQIGGITTRTSVAVQVQQTVTVNYSVEHLLARLLGFGELLRQPAGAGIGGAVGGASTQVAATRPASAPATAP